MAKLTTCKDCGHELSKSANTCPHCGKPQRKTSGCVWILLILLGLMIIGMIGGNKDKPAPPQATPTPRPTPLPTATPDPNATPTPTPLPTATPDPNATPTATPTININSQAHLDQVKKLFSAWDGQHYTLSKAVKERMNNPDSFKHVSTKYIDKGDHLLLEIVFRGTNKMNAIVTNTCYAKSTLDGEISELSCQ